MAELSQYGVSIDYAIVDAGYLSEGNRLVYLKKAGIDVYGNAGYAYIV